MLDTWNAISDRCPGTQIDTFVVMPNHIHGIVILVGAGLALPGLSAIPEGAGGEGAASSAPTHTHTLGDIMRVFKSTSAIGVNYHLGRRGSLWQRNFYERIIRDDTEMAHVREYIKTNPARWNTDTENPIVYGVGAGLAMPNPTTIPGGAASGAPTGIQGRCSACSAPEQPAIAVRLKEPGCES